MKTAALTQVSFVARSFHLFPAEFVHFVQPGLKFLPNLQGDFELQWMTLSTSSCPAALSIGSPTTC